MRRQHGEAHLERFERIALEQAADSRQVAAVAAVAAVADVRQEVGTIEHGMNEPDVGRLQFPQRQAVSLNHLHENRSGKRV